MTSAAAHLTQKADVAALRAALAPIQGIARVILATGRGGEEALWVLFDTDDLEPGSQVTEALLDLEPFEVHFVPPYSAGMMPDGRSIL